MTDKPFEVEQKYRIRPDALPELEARLLALQAELKPAVEQVDTYFAHPNREFAQTDEALRLRQVGEANFVTYKGPKIDKTTKTRREIEFPLPPGATGAEQFQQLFVALSFEPVFVVRKERRSLIVPWELTSVEVALDSVDGLGQFVELEISAEESELDSARAALASLAEHLDLQQPERAGYLELLLGEQSAGSHESE